MSFDTICTGEAINRLQATLKTWIDEEKNPDEFPGVTDLIKPTYTAWKFFPISDWTWVRFDYENVNCARGPLAYTLSRAWRRVFETEPPKNSWRVLEVTSETSKLISYADDDLLRFALKYFVLLELNDVNLSESAAYDFAEGSNEIRRCLLSVYLRRAFGTRAGLPDANSFVLKHLEKFLKILSPTGPEALINVLQEYPSLLTSVVLTNTEHDVEDWETKWSKIVPRTPDPPHVRTLAYALVNEDRSALCDVRLVAPKPFVRGRTKITIATNSHVHAMFAVLGGCSLGERRRDEFFCVHESDYKKRKYLETY